ncbi:MAG: hypothetical protein IT383_00145 [Deltaproteobacteria bacterium]|nr:hypothetical protein [Deltaproteobacteria bacterium]
MTKALLTLCGYDVDIVARVAPGERRFLIMSAALSVVAALLCGVGLGYGGMLTLGLLSAPPLFAVGTLFMLNLMRLQHAGSGYPLHLPIEEIGNWRPAFTGVVVLFALGLLVVQPLALLFLKRPLDDDIVSRIVETAVLQHALGVVERPPPADGLILRARFAWELHALPMALASAGLALMVAAPAWLRIVGVRALRRYESERWIRDRMFVDDEWAVAQDIVTSTLARTAPGFSGALQTHHADAPYNTRPLLFGLDPSAFVEGGVRWVKQGPGIDPTPDVPPGPVPWWELVGNAEHLRPPVPEPLEVERPAAPEQPAPPPPPKPAPEQAAAPPPPPPKPAAPPPPPSPPVAPRVAPRPVPLPRVDLPDGVLGMGRLDVKTAMGDIEGTARYAARYLERPQAEVEQQIRHSVDSAQLFRIFPEWNRLPTLLLKDSGTALDLGLAPLIAIAVGRPADQVERRLRAAPPDKKVSAVFSPELARIVLRKG